MHQPLVDYHCHLDLFPNYEAAFAEYRREAIEVLTVTTTPRAWEKNVELAAGSQSIRVGLGLHPQLVAEGRAEIDHFESLLSRSRYVAEVGLDGGPRFYKTLPAQRIVFERVLRACSAQGGKILSVHAVRTAREVVSMLKTHLPEKRARVVLHWFTGSVSEARAAAEIGCFFSINTQMLTSESRREFVGSLPLGRILTESDAPFTTTAGASSNSKPSDVYSTLTAAAPLFGMDATALQVQVWKNVQELESFHGL